MARFTEYGFERDPLQTIIANERSKWKTRLGANGVDVDSENSLLNILATITAESKFQADQVMEEVVANLTLAGAEGVYLDNILGKVTPRAAPTAGYVNALVECNYETSQAQQVLTTTLFNTKDGKKLYPSTSTTLSENVIAFYIDPSKWNALSSGVVVTFTIVRAGVTYTQTFNRSTGLWPAISPSINTWLTSTVGISSSLIIFQTNASAIYVGYALQPYATIIGVGSRMTVLCSQQIITTCAEVTVTNEKVGYSPIATNTISSISPTFTGYIRAFNKDAGYAGSNAESDAAYYLRYKRITNDPIAVTREGMERALIEAGLSRVAIVTNPSTPNTGSVYVSGTPNDGRTIGKVIFDSKPIGFVTVGSSSESITSVYNGGITEIVYWSSAGVEEIDININYQTTGGALTATEETELRTIINDFINSLVMGTTFLTSQIDATIIRNFSSERLTSVQSQVKAVAAGSYTTGTINLSAATEFYQIPNTLVNIIFTQV